MKIRHTITLVVEGEEDLVKTVAPQAVGTAVQIIHDGSEGRLRWRTQALCEVLDDDWNVVPSEVLLRAHRERIEK